MEGDDVDIPLAENKVGTLGFFGKVDAVQIAPFAVDDGLGGVHILRLGFVQHPTAEGHDLPPHVHHWEHEPVSELVVQPALLILHHQPCGQQLRFGVTLVQHGGQQSVPAVQSRAQTEVHGSFPADAPPVQVCRHRRALRTGEVLVIPPGGVLVQSQHPLAAA